MKISNILFTAALAFKYAYAKENTDVLNQYEENIKTKDFQYTFYCLDNYNDSCNLIKKDFKEALSILSNTFEFKKPLNFEVYIDDLTKYGFGHSTGGALDINYVILKEKSSDNKEMDKIPPYLYTQALAKQLNIENGSKIEYKANDFIIALNNFKMDPEKFANFERKRYSRLIVREIIHAMGFTSTEVIAQLKDTEDMLKMSPSFIKNDGSNTFRYIPNVLSDIDWNQLSKVSKLEDYVSELYDSKFIGLSPLTVFAKNIVDIKTKEKLFKDLGFYYKDFNCIKDQEDVEAIKDVLEKHRLECFKQLDEKTKETVTNIAMKYFLKSKSIGFLTDAGKVIPLQTFEDMFHPGSSINHIQFDKYDEIRDDPEKKTEFLKGTFITKENISDYYNEEALMYYTQGDSISNEEFLETIAKSNAHGLIGPSMVEALKTLGWTEKGKESESKRIYYFDEKEVPYPEQNTFKYVNMKIYEITMSQQTSEESENSSEKKDETKENETKQKIVKEEL
ncbi:hypothetical protein H8356DRAFT_1033529 [Neocallimastix lanati (nom. inval.)]|jgi:hypothetical protein|uniref:Uncharacterized protein n=1 Tax=Neocallimastix californiae TaxID=1754190 RepID=A0A1Y2AP66_9FUNG|nr:hypothetical protein H8356DRAFT_1033529 [Neocallimastix sp. JGI-2020a]ORY24090.1 hypothetical protein LY90DRAFT_675322 [Neocallimastix californiae]|eukprot:ORY24090.1 hypothetical protein LY90DRAFT_675322 [Neocallimastix californiae]